MKMVKAYHRNPTLEDAYTAYSKAESPVRYLAGGTDLLIHLSSPQQELSTVVSLSAIEELRGISLMDQEVRIGAMTSVGEIASSSLLHSYFSALPQAAHELGSPPIRNRATIGGNICNASPSGDLLSPLLAADSTVVLWRPGGTRRLPLAEFLLGPGKTALEKGEILTEVRIPSHEGAVSRFRKIGKKNAVEISIVNACLTFKTEAGRISDVRIALGAVGPVPLRAVGAEALLRNSVPGRETIAAAADKAALEAQPISDVRGSAGYRREMVRNLIRGMLADALFPNSGADGGE